MKLAPLHGADVFITSLICPRKVTKRTAPLATASECSVRLGRRPRTPHRRSSNTRSFFCPSSPVHPSTRCLKEKNDKCLKNGRRGEELAPRPFENCDDLASTKTARS